MGGRVRYREEFKLWAWRKSRTEDTALSVICITEVYLNYLQFTRLYL